MNRSKSYTNDVRKKLTERQRDTAEVKEILTGAGFKKIKPKYSSKPTLKHVEAQHQVLSHEVNTEFQERLYGKKQNLRHLDPAMSKIMAWGEYDPPVKNDFTANNKAFQEKYKINKMGVEFISEKQDNFRDYQDVKNQKKEQRIVEYLQNENQQIIRQKIFKNLLEKDQMSFFTTEYRDQSKKNDIDKNPTAVQLHQFFDDVTVAGKPRYLKSATAKNDKIKMPQEFKDQQLEEKIRDVWKVHKLDPQLRREEDEENDLEVQKQPTQASTLTSASANKKSAVQMAQQAQDEQNRELTQEQQKELREKLKDLKLSSRWLPDSALTTYFGKPAFHAYGNGNTNPTVGGGIYGQYMKTHNINPHSGGNRPEFSQIHERAMLGGTIQIRAPGSKSPRKKPIKMTRKPIPPRIAPSKHSVSEKEVYENLKKRFPIQADTFDEAQARELVIVPPKFTEKNLKTKKVKVDERMFAARSPTQKGNGRDSEMQKKSKQSKHVTNEESSQANEESQASSGSHQNMSQRTRDSNTQNTQSESQQSQGERQSYTNQQESPSAQEYSERANQNARKNTSKLTGKASLQEAPFCNVHGRQEGTALEYLQLLDPKNYKFLPPTFSQQIRPAGKLTQKSMKVSDILKIC